VSTKIYTPRRHLVVIHAFPHRARLLLAALCAVLMPLAFSTTASASPHQYSHSHPRTWQVSVGQETRSDAIQGMAFLPGSVWINVGDKIVWTARAGELHTVTFLAKGVTTPPPLTINPLDPTNPFDPNQIFPVGGSHYDGLTYHNSGLLTDESNSGFPANRSYSLTFDKRGNYTYWCLVHGVMMKGTVHVRRAGSEYPFTQAQYDRHSAELREQILRDGFKLWQQTRQQATNSKVFAGADDGTAMVMRFIKQTVHVRVGSSITFTNAGMAAPHTVTFGSDPANIFLPFGDPAHFTGQQLNSGILPPGGSFTVTFQKKGTFAYHCALHDYMGMIGTVVVGDH